MIKMTGLPATDTKREKKVVLTGICQRNRFRVNITEEPTDRREGHQRNGAGATKHHGVEDSGLLVRGPAEITEGRRPELRIRHCDRLYGWMGRFRNLKVLFLSASFVGIQRNGGRYDQ